MIVYNYDADLEVSDTCVRSSLLSWVDRLSNKPFHPLQRRFTPLQCWSQTPVRVWLGNNAGMLMHRICWTMRSFTFLHALALATRQACCLWYCCLGRQVFVHACHESIASKVAVALTSLGTGVVIGLEQGADYLHMVQVIPLHRKTPSSLAHLNPD